MPRDTSRMPRARGRRNAAAAWRPPPARADPRPSTAVPWRRTRSTRRHRATEGTGRPRQQPHGLLLRLRGGRPTQGIEGLRWSRSSARAYPETRPGPCLRDRRWRRSGLNAKSRRRPIFPKGCPLSIFGAGELDFRVRDGNGYGLSATVTGLRLAKSEFMAEHQAWLVSSGCISRPPTGADEASWRSSPRPLVALCCSHHWPSTCALSSR